MFSGIVQSMGTIGEFIQQNEVDVLVVKTEEKLSGFVESNTISNDLLN